MRNYYFWAVFIRPPPVRKQPRVKSLARLRAVQQMDIRLSDHNKGVWITTHHLGHHSISRLHYYCNEEPVSTQYYLFF